MFARAAQVVAAASKGNPIVAVTVVMLFYVITNYVEALVEVQIFGERFAHFLDPFIAGAFVVYAGYVVYWCAAFNTSKE